MGLTWTHSRGRHRKIAATYTALPIAILLGISGGCIHDAESGVRDVKHEKHPGRSGYRPFRSILTYICQPQPRRPDSTDPKTILAELMWRSGPIATATPYCVS